MEKFIQRLQTRFSRNIFFKTVRQLFRSIHNRF